jgi:hypothetical protein
VLNWACARTVNFQRLVENPVFKLNHSQRPKALLGIKRCFE